MTEGGGRGATLEQFGDAGVAVGLLGLVKPIESMTQDLLIRSSAIFAPMISASFKHP